VWDAALTLAGAALKVHSMQPASASNGGATSALRTRVCDLFGIDVPICLAGMGGVSMAPLVAAVSNAGGLGIMGAANLSPDGLRNEIRRTRELTTRPFAVDLLAPIPEMIEPYLPVLFDEDVRIFVAGLAVPEKHLGEMKRRGIKIMVMTGKVQHAVRAEQAGADVVAAQGTEAGGHTGEIGTLALVPQVVDAVKIPVLAAGGITDGRGVVAALALGAQGAIIGTRFIATLEATAAKQYREALVRARQDDTVRTRCYSGKPLRTLKNPYVAQYEANPSTIKRFPEQLAISSARQVMAYWNPEADPERTCMPAGQGIGSFHDIRPAGEVLQEISAQAADILRRGIVGPAGAA
jgi:enoyl-[acyl-carrier protein] reductase II